MRRLAAALVLSALTSLASPLAAAQSSSGPPWQACAAIADAGGRLACYDRWAREQPPAAVAAPAQTPAPAARPATAAATAPAPAPATTSDASGRPSLTTRDGCQQPGLSDLTRFWELRPEADCGTFGLRVFRPISMDLVTADRVNKQPTSGNPANNATTAVDYDTSETRIQLSIRTKLAGNLLTRDRPGASDSLWFAYSQQSYWQVFSPQLSRPFRATDHEPEVIYIMPLQSEDPQAWRLRLAGLGLVHQSDGQSLPLSRSWNRIYLLAGAEGGPWEVQGRLWKRLQEAEADDDNPGIENYIGRSEVRLAWRADRKNTMAATVRASLRQDTRGSFRLEWFHALADDGKGGTGGLQLRTQYFSGYGDSLLDYNFRRNVFSIGLSLVDW